MRLRVTLRGREEGRKDVANQCLEFGLGCVVDLLRDGNGVSLPGPVVTEAVVPGDSV